MIKKMGYEWRLRQLMAGREMYQTSDLVPLLAERGVCLSREQVYRLVTHPPQRMSMDTLVALCDIFGCTPNDLITIRQAQSAPQLEKAATGDRGIAGLTPAKARIRQTPDDRRA